jgi:hypothetical protein
VKVKVKVKVKRVGLWSCGIQKFGGHSSNGQSLAAGTTQVNVQIEIMYIT